MLPIKRDPQDEESGAEDRLSESTLDERVRDRNVTHSFDFLDLENTETRLPAVELEERIVVRAQSFWRAHASRGVIEHPSQARTINRPALNRKTDNAPRELVHDDHDPVRAQRH